MSEINLADNMMEIFVKLSKGNPGAMSAIMEIFTRTATVDPDNALGGLGVLLYLDTLGIYGTDIYVLYSDICDRDIVKTLTVLRASQLGFISGETIKDATSRQDYSGKSLIPVDELYTKVKERLPSFDSK